MWAVLKDGILESGRNILGPYCRLPDWFSDNTEALKSCWTREMPFLLIGYSLGVIGIGRDMLQKKSCYTDCAYH